MFFNLPLAKLSNTSLPSHNSIFIYYKPEKLDKLFKKLEFFTRITNPYNTEKKNSLISLLLPTLKGTGLLDITGKYFVYIFCYYRPYHLLKKTTYCIRFTITYDK